jgi:hypothetical protein
MKRWIAFWMSFLWSVCVSFAQNTIVIESHFLKTWVISAENLFYSVDIHNTGTYAIPVAKEDLDIGDYQIAILPATETENDGRVARALEAEYRQGKAFEPDMWTVLAPDERRVVRCGFSGNPMRFSPEMRVKVGFYCGDGQWFYSDPITLTGVKPEQYQFLKVFHERKINARHNPATFGLWEVIHQGEHWLYSRYIGESGMVPGDTFYPLCEISHPDKIRVETLEQHGCFYIYDGDKKLLLNNSQSRIEEGDSRYMPLLNWTRERKAAADKHNAALKKVVHEVNEIKE